MKYLDAPAIILFIVISLAGILQHFILLQLTPEWNLRVLQAAVLGCGYDLMNGAVFGSLALLTPLPNSSRKMIFGIIGTLFLAFLFTDYNYVLLFGNHLPFSSYEYFYESSAFWSSAIHAVQSFEFLLLFFNSCLFVSVVLLCCLVFLYK